MRVLLIGSGGREHSLAWKISQSPLLTAFYAAPGSPGIARYATCLPVGANDVAGVVKVAEEERIDLVVVGPEEPLALGLVDQLAVRGILAFGPTQAAARLESSKAWAKEFMHTHGIPTASYRVFSDWEQARSYAAEQTYPLVIKASGLAAGKGAVVVENLATAEQVLQEMLQAGRYGAAGHSVVIESFLTGQEVSLFALVDGESYLLLPSAQDHKRVFDGDQGPNTGGMGAYSPVPAFSAELQQQAVERILLPTIRGLRQLGCPYRGVLYLGLMLTAEGPQVIEFNARFGDPEAQVVLPRIKSDLLPLLQAAASGQLHGTTVELHQQACATVVISSPGYPGTYPKGLPICGIEQAEELGCLVFQAGTSRRPQGLVTSGGRILAVSALGDSLAAAVAKAYSGVREINIPGAHYRRDIAHHAL
ncbi:MAG: phosphoribosylamine--glycine ligase [Bacillota bacterium]